MKVPLLATPAMKLVIARNLLSRAKNEIAKGETALQTAADYIAKAQELGATQREIASRLEKSASWVNAMLHWHKSGYEEETPFGSQSKASRERRRVRRVQSPEREQANEPDVPPNFEGPADTNNVTLEVNDETDTAGMSAAASAAEQPTEVEPLPLLIKGNVSSTQDALEVPAILDRRPLCAAQRSQYKVVQTKWDEDGILTREDWRATPPVVRERLIKFLRSQPCSVR